MYEILLGEVLAALVGMYGLLTLNRLIVAGRLSEERQLLAKEQSKMWGQIGQMKGQLGEMSGMGLPQQLGDLGIDGVIDALGIPAPFKMVAKGFIERLMSDPEKLKELAARFGFDIDKLTGSGGVESVGGFK